MTDEQQHIRACIQCRGEGWITGPIDNGWTTVAPCPECRPVTATRHRNGEYRIDAPHRRASGSEEALMDTTRPKIALWPWPDILAEHPAPGPRPQDLER